VVKNQISPLLIEDYLFEIFLFLYLLTFDSVGHMDVLVESFGSKAE
jgi:hypothetical protein